MFNTVLNWSVAAILASFTMMPVSVNRSIAPAVEPNKEEAVLKGCATKFADDDRIPFYFDDSQGNTKADVENLDNWKVGEPDFDCGGNQVACMILADENHVDNPTTPTKLTSNIGLVVDDPFGAGIITGVASGSAYENRSL